MSLRSASKHKFFWFISLVTLAAGTLLVIIHGDFSGKILNIGLGEAVGRISVPEDIFLFSAGVFLIINTFIIILIRKKSGRKYLLSLQAATFVLLIIMAAAGEQGIDLTGLTAQSIRMATPVILGALCGLLCERSGIINIGIEGMMLAGACFGFTAALYTGSLFLGFLAAIAAGAVLAMLHALMSIKFRTDQIISGTVINILAIGITGFTRRSFLLHAGRKAPGVFPTWKIPLLSKIPVLGDLFFNHQPIVYLMFITLLIIHPALKYTRWGLRTRASGEHPKAVDTLGVNVIRLRYLNLVLAGLIAGAAGAWFSLETTGGFDDLMTNGKGFIALAAMIFGKWHPLGGAMGGLLFGFTDAVQIKFQVLGLPIPYQFLGMLPYLVTMLTLAGVVGKALPPAAVGKPYPE